MPATQLPPEQMKRLLAAYPPDTDAANLSEAMDTSFLRFFADLPRPLLHGERIWVEEEYLGGVGGPFAFTLPLVKSVED